MTVSQKSLSEMEQMCLIHMWMNEGLLLVTKLLMGLVTLCGTDTDLFHIL